MKTVRFLAVLSLAAGSAACTTSSSTRPRSYQKLAQTQWHKRIRDLGMVEILPLTEDIRVGDLYAFVVNPEAVEWGGTSSSKAAAAAMVSRQIAAGSRWASIPVLAELDREYRARPSWPRTPEVFLGASPTEPRTWAEATVDDNASVFAPTAAPSRLRLVALNELSAITFSGADLESLIPAEAAALVAGQANPGNLAVSMRPGPAESYALPLDTLIGLATEPSPDSPGIGYRLKAPYRNGLTFLAQPPNTTVFIQMISEVLYIRNADISVRSLHSTPADDHVSSTELANVAVAAAQQSQTQPTDTAEPGGDQPPPDATEPAAQTDPGPDARKLVATKLDPIYGAFVRADSINKILRSTNSDVFPGGSVRFISVTDESVALRRIWQRGVAVGVRGLTLKVDAATGNILAAGPMGIPLPEAPRPAGAPR